MEKLSKLTEAHLKLILVNLAKFHVSNCTVIDKCKIKNKLLDDRKLSAIETLKTFLDTNSNQKITKNEILKKIEDALIKFENLSKYTVCHGNLKKDNISLDSNKKSCRFLNSSNLYLPVLFDVVTFLAETDIDSLYDFENKMQFYARELQELSNEMLLVLSKDVIKNSYQILTLFSVLEGISNSPNSIKDLVEKLIDVFLMNPAILEDCIEVMTKELGTTEFSVTNYQQKLLSERGGFLGEHSILKINTNSSSQDYSFFVKTLPEIGGQRDFLNEINGSFKENQFFGKYLSLLKQQKIHLLDDCIPICYLSNEEMLILQDLGCEKYVSFDCRSSLDLDYTKAALKSLSKFHASGLVLEELIGRQLQQKYRLINDFQEELKEGFYSGKGMPYSGLKACKTGVPAVVELIGDVVIGGKSGVELFEESLNKQIIFAQPSTKYRNTICHGDLWTKNLMFKTDHKGIDCIIVDFQTYRYSPPAQDVMAFLCLVTDKDFRKNHLDELLDFYFNQLKQNLDDYNCGNIVSREEFENSCKYFRQFALTQRISHLQVVAMSKEIIHETFKDPEQGRKSMFENRYDCIKNACNKDPIYKELNCGAVQEIFDFFKEQL